METNYQELWNKTKEALSRCYDEDTFSGTFEEVKKVIKFQNGTIFVLAPNVYIKTKLYNMYSEKINDVLKTLTPEKLKFKFVTESEITKEVPTSLPSTNRLYLNNLNENFNFESFVVGESNMFGYRMSMNVAEQPGLIANPLYIFGGVGLGKTHLMQAIGNYILDKDINKKILYVQANDFIVDYSKATQSGNMLDFDEKYGNLDCLLVDDIQMLEIGKKSQQEFFKLFNDLINRKKQIVITSDCPANQLKGIMERLTSRFSSGMTVDIKQPDLEQRVNILRRKALELSTKKVPDEVLSFIAENFTDNIRELEGALNRVLGHSEVCNYDDITLERAADALEALLRYKKTAPKSSENYENVLSIIANFYNISVNDLISNQRKQAYVLPRHIAMYILKEHFKLPYKKIGQILGNRDHTTIMSGCTKIESEIKTDRELKMAVDTIIKKVD